MSKAAATVWLKIAIIAYMIVGGLVLAMASHPALVALPNMFVDLVFWPFDGAPSVIEPAARFVSAIGGGAFFGWGIAYWCIMVWVLPANPDGARKIMLAGLLSWCALDSVGSILSGAYANLILNALILFTFLIPLRAIR